MIIVITGISRGIGRAIMLEGLRLGYTCIGITRTTSNIDESINDHNNAHVVKVDWSNMDQISSWIKSLIDGKTVDILINNAATIHVADLHETGKEVMLSQFETNCVQPFLLSKSLFQAELFTESAHIVNVGSMAGYQDSSKFPGLGAYSASKAALACLTQSMATEWGEHLSINCLCPGAVNTEMLKRAFPDYVAPINDVQMASYIVQFALSAPQIINGQVIPVKKEDPN